jgi:uncharacterized protein YndB with AHSA1/START domain
VARIRVSTVIDAPPAAVWAAIDDVATHVAWMEDAVAIRFRSAQTTGVGTVFECDTKIGPIRLVDVMEITEWRPGKAMGVRHTGIVTGEGGFRLRRARGGRTRFTWDERFRFPWYFLGPVGGVLGGTPILTLVWRKNLANLKALVEGSS